MKFTKLSLAALVAIGTFSAVSAQPLEDAIKDVDYSGYLRYRYTNTRTVTKNDQTKEVGSKGQHQYKGVLNFRAAIDDNFFSLVQIQYVNKGQGVSGERETDNLNDDGKNFTVRQALLGYKVGNTTITGGRQLVGSFFTDDMVGTGLRITNSDIQGLTLGAIAFDNLDSGGDSDVKHNSSTQHNLFGLAAIGSYDPVSFQLWYGKLKNVADLFAGELAVGFENFGLTAQVGFTNPNGDLKRAKALQKGVLFGAEANANIAGLDARLGYVHFKAKENNGEPGEAIVSYEDKGGFFDVGQQSPLDYNGFEGKNNFGWLAAGYTFDKFRVGGDVVLGTTKMGEEKTKHRELVARLNYAYSKKLNFGTWYSTYTAKHKDSSKETSEKYRFEAKYSF